MRHDQLDRAADQRPALFPRAPGARVQAVHPAARRQHHLAGPCGFRRDGARGFDPRGGRDRAQHLMPDARARRRQFRAQRGPHLHSCEGRSRRYRQADLGQAFAQCRRHGCDCRGGRARRRRCARRLEHHPGPQDRSRDVPAGDRQQARRHLGAGGEADHPAHGLSMRPGRRRSRSSAAAASARPRMWSNTCWRGQAR